MNFFSEKLLQTDKKLAKLIFEKVLESLWQCIGSLLQLNEGKQLCYVVASFKRSADTDKNFHNFCHEIKKHSLAWNWLQNSYIFWNSTQIAEHLIAIFFLIKSLQSNAPLFRPSVIKYGNICNLCNGRRAPNFHGLVNVS